MVDYAKSTTLKHTQPPTNKEWQALQVEPKSWKKLWKPKQDPSSTEQQPIFWGRPEPPSKLEAGGIFFGFLVVFLLGAAGVAYLETGFLGAIKPPSYGRTNLVSNVGFQTFYYEAGQEIWIDETTEIQEGRVQISIWTSDKLFSWNMIDKVFEYDVMQSETNEITWVVPESGYYRIVVASGKFRLIDLNGSSNRRYLVKWGIKKTT